MATATKEKPAATAAQKSIAQTAVDEAMAKYVAADDLLLSLDPDQPLRAVEREVLRQAGIVDFNQIQMERGRVQAVKRWMERAKTQPDLVEAEKALLRATKAQKDAAPGLQAEIEKLQAQLDALDRTRSDALAVLNGLTDARARLRQLVPKFIREQYDADVAAATWDTRQQISELESEIKLIDELQQLEDERGRILHAETAAPHLLTTEVGPIDGRGNRVSKVRFDAAGWDEYVRERAAQRPVLVRRVEELRVAQSKAITALDSQLDFYVGRL